MQSLNSRIIQLPINFRLNKLPRNLVINQKFTINSCTYIIEEIYTILSVYDDEINKQEKIEKIYRIRELIN